MSVTRDGVCGARPASAAALLKLGGGFPPLFSPSTSLVAVGALRGRAAG